MLRSDAAAHPVAGRSSGEKMSIKLANRMAQIRPSATIAVNQKAAALRAKGRDIVSLAFGEPDFDTPEHIREAAKHAIDNGETRYPPIAGTPRLNQAIRDKLSRENNLEYSPEQVVVTCGAKQAIFNLLLALLNEDDEVIIPAPYWVSYPDMVKLAGGQPMILNAGADSDFKITPRHLETAINEDTRLLLLNSPSNPTGKVYKPSEYRALGKVLREYPKLTVVCDDIYEHIYWSETPFRTLLNECPDLADRVVIVNGVSKAYAMTGWRIGYAAGPEALIETMRKIQGQSTSGACSISQAAAAAALEGPQDCLEPMRLAFKQRHDRVVEALNAIEGVECPTADGAFYAFPSFEGVIESLPDVRDDVELAEWLLEKAGIGLVPGTAFGAPGRLRLSFAASIETLEQSIERIRMALSE
jgi:aspartate aminotransferase